jgi:hypothetical protein
VSKIEFVEYEQLIEKILKYFAGPTLRDELSLAKSEFFGNSGTLDEQSDHYELRMSQFYDWYFFTRELKGYGHTPLDSCHLVRELRFSEDEENLIQRLKESRHSLFEVTKIKGSELTITDLFRQEKITLTHDQNLHGIEVKDIFDVRLLPNGSSWIFTKGFCFHPAEARKFILAEVKKHIKDPDLDRELFTLRLIKMKYKFEQYRHVSPDLVYSEQNVLKI